MFHLGFEGKYWIMEAFTNMGTKWLFTRTQIFTWALPD